MLKKISSISILVVYLLCAAHGLAAETKNTVTYQNKANNFYLQYPGDWWAKEGIMGSVVAFMSSAEPVGQPHFNANIVLEDVSPYPGLTLEKYTALSIVQLRRGFDNFRLISNEPFTLSNQPARLLSYTCKQDGYDFVMLQVLTLYYNKAYVIIAGTEKTLFPKYEAEVKLMINSFTFK
ncbi:MAG: hypothetical protein H6Q73_4314 [Firmicutes bacterium]|nr:hypothetical protein [Bacillota bacterium]